METAGSLTFEVNGQSLTVEKADVEIISEDMPGWLVSNEGNLTVALEVELTDDLKKEGVARELINRIQNLRKDSGFEITDRITITVSSYKESDETIAQFGDLIKSQVLANDIQIAPNQGTVVEFDEFSLNISITKI